MNVNELFQGDYLKAADIKSRCPMSATVQSFRVEQFEEGEKPVIQLAELDGDLVLNRTNTSMIAHLYSPESDNWTGRPITLTVEPVSFQGRIVDAIRVHAPQLQPQAAPQPEQAPQVISGQSVQPSNVQGTLQASTPAQAVPPMETAQQRDARDASMDDDIPW